MAKTSTRFLFTWLLIGLTGFTACTSPAPPAPTPAPSATSPQPPEPSPSLPAPPDKQPVPPPETAVSDCQAGDANQSPLFDHHVYLTATTDGLQFQREETRILAHASVPDVVVGPDGALWVYFVNGRPGQHGIFAARAAANDGEWEIVDCVRLDGIFEGNAVDPDITRLDDGRYRLVYFLGSFVRGSALKPGQPHPIYSAISEDGLNFTVEGQLIAVEGVTDPSLLQLPDGSWLLAMAQSGQALLATSQDGRQFALTGVTFEAMGIPELALLPDGRVALYLDQIYISADDGQTWQAQAGRRVPGGGADPSLTMLADGSYAFAYKKIEAAAGSSVSP